MTTIDIESGRESSCHELATSMTKELNALSSLSSNCCIYRVPERLRCVDENMYTPKVVSIGPLHHGNPAFKVMEDQKKWYLRHFLQRSTNVPIEDYIEKIQIEEKSLRNCYKKEDVARFDSEKFVKIILVDTVFIIELFLLIEDNKKQKTDSIFGVPHMLLSIIPDMILLENQVPFSILKELYVIAGIASVDHLSELVYNFLTRVADLDQKGEKVYLEKRESLNCIFDHFVDLLRTLYVPSPTGRGAPEDNLGRQSSSRPRLQTVFNGFGTALYAPLLNKSKNPQTGSSKEEEHPETPFTHNVTYLHRAGVKTELESSRKHLFDIQFENGILKIPKIKIQDNTELILRNLMAFEQCSCIPKDFRNNYLGDYVYTLDKFVNTAEDVDLLVEKKVIMNMLGDSKQVCDLINRLGDGNLVNSNDSFHFAPLFENLNNYCKKRRHKWMATLRQDYFNTPWASISFVAAVVLLVLGVISTVCALISVNT